MAVLLGAGNAILLAGGLAMVRFTRYQLAGRALTLLACLVMPLNLWFYDYQDLLKIEDGRPSLARRPGLRRALRGRGVRCCATQCWSTSSSAASTLTGLLLLADPRRCHLFWEARGPVTIARRASAWRASTSCALFPEGEGPFTRRKFGLAFFWSGHAVLAAGLLVLLAAQLTCGLLYDYFRGFYEQLDVYLGYPVLHGPSEIVETVSGQLLALGVVAAATYAYVYSDLVVRKVGVYIHLAVAVSCGRRSCSSTWRSRLAGLWRRWRRSSWRWR